MIRYRLIDPGSSAGGREVAVFLVSGHADEPARIRVAGDHELAEVVRTRLRSARGDRASLLGEVATPHDLDIAMRGPELRQFSPELVTGAEVLQRRLPPLGTPEEIGQTAGSVLASALVLRLAGPAPVDADRQEQLREQLDTILRHWRALRMQAAGAAEAAALIAPALGSGIKFHLNRSRRLHGGAAPRSVIPEVLDDAGARRLAEALAEVLDGADEQELDALAVALRERAGAALSA